jgi:large subunit ribosomal protein L18
MNPQKAKHIRQRRRRHHVRRGITGTPERPRLTVFRSSKHIYAQLIDDLAGATLACASSLAPDVRKDLPYGGNIKAAQVVGKKLAEAAKQKGIDKAAFDRGHYKFHGRVKALAEAANAAGLMCCEPKERKKAKMAAEAAVAAAAKPEKAEKAPKEKKEKKEKKEQPPKTE